MRGKGSDGKEKNEEARQMVIFIGRDGEVAMSQMVPNSNVTYNV